MKDVYVITGATGGMGADTAKSFGKKGTVVLADLDEKKLEKLKKEMKTKGIKTETIKCDVSKKKDVDALVELVRKLGNFKAMIHTAGVSEHMDNAEKILQINLVGTKMLMDAFYEIANKSVFVTIASMTGHLVPDSGLYNNLLLNPLQSRFLSKMKIFASNSQNAYAFSKKGIILITERDVAKWAEKSSRIISVSPGAIETPLSLKEAKNNPAVDYMISKTPVPRYGQPGEVTDLVKFLISDKAEFITGIDILIDGGIVSYMKYNDIFNMKANKVPKIAPFIIYLFTFLFFPLFFEFFLNGHNLQVVRECLTYFVNPAVVILVTLYMNKHNFSLYLTLLPFGVSIFSYLIMYQNFNFTNGLFYLLVALFVSIIVSIYKKSLENAQ